MNTDYDFLSRLNAFENLPILVVGDLILDRYVKGKTERLSSEGPIPVQVIQREIYTLGGAGNLVANLSGLGLQCYCVGICGRDEAGSQLKRLLGEKVENISDIHETDERPTTLKTRFMVGPQQVFRSDIESKFPVSGNDEDILLERISNVLGCVKAVILSDYGLGVLTPRLCQETIQKSRQKNIPVLVDPRGTDFKKYSGADVVTPNKKELSLATFGMPVETDADVVAASKKLITDNDIRAVIATRSEKGMTILEAASLDNPVHRPARPVEVYDVTGAGDTVIATIGACVGSGSDLVEAADLGGICARLVVQKVGTAPVRKEEVRKALTQDDPTLAILHKDYGSPDEMIFDEWETPEEIIHRWQANGRKVGFTNGCFDIIHSGHIAYLTEARRLCDRLIIGLNCDNSVRRLKGEDRPANPQKDRALVLAALKAVDMVVIFGERDEENDQACLILDALKPDIYFKGGDYSPQTLPEAATVKRYGGEVYFCSILEGKSTTGIIEQLSSPDKKNRVA